MFSLGIAEDLPCELVRDSLIRLRVAEEEEVLLHGGTVCEGAETLPELSQKVLSCWFLDRCECLCLERPSDVSLREHFLDAFEYAAVVECLLFLHPLCGDHEPGHDGLEDDLLLGLADLAAGARHALVDQLQHRLAQPAARQRPQLAKHRQDAHEVFRGRDVTQGHQRVLQVLDQARNYVMSERRACEVDHAYQSAIHECLMR